MKILSIIELSLMSIMIYGLLFVDIFSRSFLYVIVAFILVCSISLWKNHKISK